MHTLFTHQKYDMWAFQKRIRTRKSEISYIFNIE